MKTILIDNSDVSTDWIKGTKPLREKRKKAMLKKSKSKPKLKTKILKKKGKETAMQDELVYGPGKGKGGGPYKMGPGGNCICPTCDFIKPHTSGNPCTDDVCPKCATPLVREEVLKVIQSIMHR